MTVRDHLWLWWHASRHGTSNVGGVLSCTCGARRLRR